MEFLLTLNLISLDADIQVDHLHTEKYFRNLIKSNRNHAPKSCIYHAPIDLKPNGRPFGSKSIGKWYIQPDFCLIQ